MTAGVCKTARRWIRGLRKVIMGWTAGRARQATPAPPRQPLEVAPVSVRNSLIDDELFPEIAPWIVVQVYARDGGAVNPRIRLELDSEAPRDLLLRAMQLRRPCVACGADIHPFRHRKTPGRCVRASAVYIAVACRLKDNMACSRGNEASDEYKLIAGALEGVAAPVRQQRELDL